MANEKRLIDANALEAEIERSKWVSKELKNSFTTHNVIACIHNAPTVDAVEVVHGRWVLVGDGVGCCSNCHRLDSIDELATHCRYCGAKLDKGGE